MSRPAERGKANTGSSEAEPPPLMCSLGGLRAELHCSTFSNLTSPSCRGTAAMCDGAVMTWEAD
jgi:hypothetical protein